MHKEGWRAHTLLGSAALGQTEPEPWLSNEEARRDGVGGMGKVMCGGVGGVWRDLPKFPSLEDRKTLIKEEMTEEGAGVGRMVSLG